jgi:hypothetical protein
VDDRFNVVLIDNALNCYGDYCEHFDVLPYIQNIMEENAFVIFNVVRKPFNYTEYPRWQDRRNKFYGLQDCSHLSSDFVKKFYTDFFDKLGLTVMNYYTECREYHDDVDYNYMVGVELHG